MLLGTVTVNEVDVAEETMAFTAPKYTVLLAATGLKLLPEITTAVPAGPESGATEVMVGLTGAIKVKPLAVAMPPIVVTETLPDGTSRKVAVILVGETMVKEVTGAPPMVTALAVEKLAPVIEIDWPIVALVGVKDEMVGESTNVKPVAVAVPPSVVTVMLPDVPLEEMVALIVVELTI
jgi:hypothetical protein